MWSFSLFSISFLLFATTSSAYELSSAPASQRATICNDQIASCAEICGDSVNANTCDSTSMQWQCVCGDGSVPSDTQITFPVPFYQCQGSQQECISDCQATAQASQMQICTDTCNSEFTCSNLTPSNGTSASTPVSAVASPTSGQTTTSTLPEPGESGQWKNNVNLLLILLSFVSCLICF